MINLSLDELKLVAKNRNIRNYGNKSEKDLIKILSEPKPKIKINKKKLEEIRKYFKELRHTFSRKEIDAYRKLQTSFNIRNKGGKKKSFEIKKNLKFKKFHGDIDSVDYDDLDNYDNNYDFADDDEYRKIGSVRTFFKKFDRDCYKPIKIDDSFDWKKNSYIEYKSTGDRYEHLSSEEYLDMIRPYLRDLINDHKPTMELTNKANSSDTKRGEWKLQLVIRNNCISSKDFEETHTIYSASKPIKIFMGSNTDDVIDILFDTTLK